MYSFKELPFITGIESTPLQTNLANTLPFALDIDENTERLIQCPDSCVEETLKSAYQSGSLLTGSMDEDGIGRLYADSFLAFIQSNIDKLKGKKILEVGCGSGYLLHQLSELGGEVRGVEPGPQGQIGGAKYGLEIIQSFFPTSQIDDKYDLILMSHVLEHVKDPISFLKACQEYLLQGGLIMASVPTCDLEIEKGEIGMLVHEHWSYFSRQTLANTFVQASYSVLELTKAGFGGSWYIMAGKNNSQGEPLGPSQHEREFVRKIAANHKKFEYLLRNLLSKGNEVGFYCPSRVVNSLFLVLKEIDVGKVKIRLFDDNKMLHGQFLPCLPFPIETRPNLLSSPTDLLLIASRTFAETIERDLLADGYRGRIAALGTVLEGNAT